MSTLKANEPFSTRYQLIRRIGVGGYSEVWLANDTLAGNMQVALKIFAPDKGLDEQGVALFSKEYALVFNLNHPNLLLPKHFDVVDGSPFLVLPYCEAGSVFSKIGLMSEADLARFLHQAASALAYLHSQEPPIIHQDIKPDNFLIDNQGNYLLSDFGISSKIRRTLTRSMGAQGSAGTMAYMPPEKFSADKQVIKAGDIFSLGVTMYELLTGDLPFGDNGGITLNIGAVVPNLPTAFSPELNELLKRCMAKEPWERPQAEELQHMAQNYLRSEGWQVSSILGSEPVKAAPPKSSTPRHTQLVANSNKQEVFQGFNGKYGYRCSQTKEIIVQAQYDEAHLFSERRAVVGRKMGLFAQMLYGFIDEQGREVIPIQFAEVRLFQDKVAFVFHKKWTLIDLDGSPLKHFPDFRPKRNFENGLAVITNGAVDRLIDTSGNELTKKVYVNISRFSEGRAIVSVSGLWRLKYGYIDTFGNEVIAPVFSKASPFSGGQATVVLKGKSMAIDLQGNKVS